MANPKLAKFQIGKNGVTDGTITSLVSALKNHKQIRISMLPSSGRNRDSIQKTALELESKLPFKLKSKVIGFTIILVKLSEKSKK